MRVSIFFAEMETKTLFLLTPPRAHFGLHFGDILGPRGAIGEILEGSENKVEKRDPPESCESAGRWGGPYEDIQMRIYMEMERDDGG